MLHWFIMEISLSKPWFGQSPVPFPTQKLKINGCSSRKIFSLFDCSNNSQITPKLMFLGSSGKTHHVQMYWVRNEDGLPGWVVFCHLEKSLLEFIQQNQVRLASLCLLITLQSHTPQMNWQFSASTNIKTGDCDVSPSKIIQHTQISLASPDSCKWEGRDGGSCVFMVVLDSSSLCGKKKQTVLYYVEGKSLLNLESFSTWIIFVFYICPAEG